MSTVQEFFMFIRAYRNQSYLTDSLHVCLSVNLSAFIYERDFQISNGTSVLYRIYQVFEYSNALYGNLIS
jgi:hypothetical protein